MEEGTILIVDDNPNVLTALDQLLESEFSQVLKISDPGRIPGILELKHIDVILLDMNFKPGDSSGEEGLHWLYRILKMDGDCVVIMMTAYGEIDLAVRAMKGGANDFIVKPWDNDKLVATIRSGLKLRRSRQLVEKLKNKQLHLHQEARDRNYKLVGESEPILKVKQMISKVAATDSSILILGENGTGKELIAREIHNQSDRRDEVFVHVDVGSISHTLFESELFGYMKGAFTDAVKDHPGRFEIASGGTIFLDEIGNLSSGLQSKLLTVIQNKEVFRLGSNKPVQIDIRIICATNQNLVELIRQKTFREDLYYRINTIEIVAPPLRERKKDILLLAGYFLDEFKKKYDRDWLYFTSAYKTELMNQQWPGNVRELRNQIERMVILSESPGIQPTRSSSNQNSEDHPAVPFHTLSSIQKEFLLSILDKNKGNISKTAVELGVARSTVYNKLKKFRTDIRDENI
jgi:DNA-binding NtrC family response regulator